jgi:hypothetical protein
METNNGMTRRAMLKRGAIAGTAVLWAVPAVQVIGLGASHAEAASGGNPTSTPTHTRTAPPTTPSSTVLPTETATGTGTPTHTPDVVTPSPSVKGISFEQPPPPQVNPPVAVLPFTGAAVPVSGAVALGAGLVATGAAAVAVTRRRSAAAAAGAGEVASTDGDLPAV